MNSILTHIFLTIGTVQCSNSQSESCYCKTNERTQEELVFSNGHETIDNFIDDTVKLVQKEMVHKEALDPNENES